MAVFTLPLAPLFTPSHLPKAKKEKIVSIDDYRGVVFLPRRSTLTPASKPGRILPTLVLPVHHRAVVLVVALLVPPVVADLVGQGVLVELDAQARARRQVEVAFADA